MIKLSKIFLWTNFSSSRGMDQAYEQASKAAERNLKEQMAGPDQFHSTSDGADIKNPDDEAEDPAPMVESAAERAAPGWDSRGDRVNDPQGQQGGTDNRPVTPPLPSEGLALDDIE